MQREITIAVYGLGRVGAAVAAVFLRHGFNVLGVDVDEEKVQKINSKEKLFSLEPHVDEAFIEGIEKGSFKATSDLADASKGSKYKILTVPVPLVLKAPDFSNLKQASESIGKGIRKGDVVIVESSVPPGTTRQVVAKAVGEASGLKPEEDFLIGYSPERIYEGRAVYDIEENYPKVVSGYGAKSLVEIAELYSKVAKKGIIKMSSMEAAELEKLAEGLYRDVNIALANELALFAQRLNVDFWEVRSAANSQPYSNIHKPGAGVGGNCIPVYPYYVLYTANRLGFHFRMVESARWVNERMPLVVVSNFVELFILNKKSLRTVALLGLAFRGDTDDDRLSPSYDIIDRLRALNVNVKVHDPYVKRPSRSDVQVSDNLEETLAKVDGIIISTDHSVYKELDYEKLAKMSGNEPIIYDARGILYGKPKIYVLGTGYKGP
ncbi:MAG: nucleotide sugar dehydrogenase [Nitrososphaeria archaeon]